MKFEDKIKKLETIIDELENGNVDLDESIKKYTDAMKLVKECDLELKKVEEKISEIVLPDLSKEEFDPNKE